MSTPTDQQQIRATIRRAGKTRAPFHVACMVIRNMADLLGTEAVDRAVKREGFGPGPTTPFDQLPPIMGASEAADMLGMKATNLKRLSPPLPVAAVISGRVPVYLVADVMAAKERRDARRATA